MAIPALPLRTLEPTNFRDLTHSVSRNGNATSSAGGVTLGAVAPPIVVDFDGEVRPQGTPKPKRSRRTYGGGVRLLRTQCAQLRSRQNGRPGSPGVRVRSDDLSHRLVFDHRRAMKECLRDRGLFVGSEKCRT